MSGMISAAYYIYRAQNPPQETVSESSESSQTVVEEEPPEVVPEASPTPRATETESKTVLAPPREPSALDWLREHKERWPAEVQTVRAMEFPARFNGKVVGSVKVPAGARVSLATIEQETLVAAYASATSRIPISATDLEARAKVEMAKPTPIPQLAARETPLPPPKSAEQVAADEKWRAQFKAGTGPIGTIMAAPTPRPDTGKVTYTLHRPKDESAEVKKIDDGLAKAMDEAIFYYNRYTKLKKHVNAVYSPGTPTADANFAGNMRFGKARNARTALHELGHCFGVGTHPNWGKLMVKGRWEGKKANKLLQEFTNKKDAQLHGDRMHIWPYGLNFDPELKSEEDMIGSAQMVEAVVEDLEDAR